MKSITMHTILSQSLKLYPSFLSICRNNEKRKEKSRDAARCRRSRETEIFTELAGNLPMKSEDIDHLDKASVMRLSIAYLKVRQMLELCEFLPAQNYLKISLKLFSIVVPEANKLDDGVSLASATDDEQHEDVKPQILSKFIEDEMFALNALDGFLLVLSDDGDVTYVSENIGDILGLAKVSTRLNFQCQLLKLSLTD